MKHKQEVFGPTSDADKNKQDQGQEGTLGEGATHIFLNKHGGKKP